MAFESLPELPALVHQTMQESAVDHLRRLILTRQLEPGQRLVQSELAEQLGISRTPVREALHKLAAEGLVVFSSYKGAAVADFSAAELEEIFTVRAALESHATYLAAQRISEAEIERLRTRLEQMEAAFRNQDFLQLLQVHQEFHAGIYAAAGQQRLYDLAIQYFELGNVYQRMALSLGRGAKDPVGEHLEIVKALERKESEQARQLVRAHVELTISELLEIFQEN